MVAPLHKYLINLKYRKDRLEAFKQSIAGIDYLQDIVVWPAISGDMCPHPPNWKAGAGAWGCYKSHVAIMEYCLNNRIGSYIVFEDDAQFRPNFEERLNEVFDSLPEDWEQVYLGGQLMHTNSRPPVQINDKICRVFNVNRTHCFALSRKGMEKVYPYISNLPFYAHDHIDHHLGRFHEDHNNKIYASNTWLIGQHGSSSNVSGKDEPIEFYDDPAKFLRSHWLYKEPMCVLYEASPMMIQDCSDFLHFGNSITTNGYDVTLFEASRYAYPLPEITKWYNWIRSECTSSQNERIPAAYHPFLTEQLLKDAGVKHVLKISSASSPENIRQQIQTFLNQYGLGK